MLTDCPQCDYSLRGLPAAHRCPECGCEYGTESRLWHPRSPFAGVAFLGVVFAILALSGVVWLAQNWRGGRALLSVNGIVANASIAIAIAWPLMVWKGGKRARCIAILPAGVLVRTHEVRRLVAWTELVGASMFERRIRDSGDDCGVRLTLDDGTTVEAIGVFASDLERGEFLSRTQARIAGVDE